MKWRRVSCWCATHLLKVCTSLYYCSGSTLNKVELSMDSIFEMRGDETRGGKRSGQTHHIKWNAYALLKYCNVFLEFNHIVCVNKLNRKIAVRTRTVHTHIHFTVCPFRKFIELNMIMNWFCCFYSYSLIWYEN